VFRVSGYTVKGVYSRTHNLSFRVLGFWIGVLDLGFSIYGLGLKVWGLGFRVSCLGFSV